VHVESGFQIADSGLELNDLGLKLLNLGALGAVGGKPRLWAVHASIIGRVSEDRQEYQQSIEILLAFLQGGG